MIDAQFFGFGMCCTARLPEQTLASKEQDRIRGFHFLVCVPSQIANFVLFFCQFHRLHSKWGQMTSATAINFVPVLEEVCTGTTRSGDFGSV